MEKDLYYMHIVFCIGMERQNILNMQKDMQLF